MHDSMHEWQCLHFDFAKSNTNIDVFHTGIFQEIVTDQDLKIETPNYQIVKLLQFFTS